MAEEEVTPDRSDAADAARFRWMLNGNGYFLEEQGLCGGPVGEDDESEQDRARSCIDEEMHEQEKARNIESAKYAAFKQAGLNPVMVAGRCELPYGTANGPEAKKILQRLLDA